MFGLIPLISQIAMKFSLHCQATESIIARSLRLHAVCSKMFYHVSGSFNISLEIFTLVDEILSFTDYFSSLDIPGARNLASSAIFWTKLATNSEAEAFHRS